MKDTEEVIATVMGFTAKQISVVVLLVAAAVGGAFWIENRYAKLRETEANIKQHKDEILQMHVKTLELIKLQPKEVQEQIERNAKMFTEQVKRLDAGQ